MNAPVPAPASPSADRVRGGLRLLAALVALAGAATATWPLLRLRLARSPLRHDTLIAPGADEASATTHVDGAGGAQLLYVDSVPEGAQVFVEGEEQGPTPVSTQLHCAAGGKVNVELRAPGFRKFTTAVDCAPDSMTRLHPRLVRR